MKVLRFSSALVAAAVLCACGPSSSYEVSSGATAEVAVSTAPGVQYLYVPGTSIPVESIEAAYVQTSDGRQLALDASQVRAVAGGRLSVAVPVGVTTGTLTIVVGGRPIEVPFHIAASMSGPVVGTLSPPAAGLPCAPVAGNWIGNLSERHPDAVATAYMEVMGDCRTVRGFISWSGPRIGSVDSTIEGYWDAGSSTLVARDTQLYNVRPLPGGGFCPTERYQLTLSPDGSTLTGLNITNAPACRGQSMVHLRRQ